MVHRPHMVHMRWTSWASLPAALQDEMDEMDEAVAMLTEAGAQPACRALVLGAWRRAAGPAAHAAGHRWRGARRRAVR